MGDDADEKPTGNSVTSVPCTCSWLANAAAEPDNPIVFDEALNEYNLAHHRPTGANGAGAPVAQSRIYHCPWCGGVAPKSKRATLFAHLTDAERSRLHDLTAAIRTIADAVAKLGPPDHDLHQGFRRMTPASDTKPAEEKSYRVIRYTKLSETADVRFTDLGPDRDVWLTLESKYVGPKK